MNISYTQQTPLEALRLYCDWLVEQQAGQKFFPIYENGKPMYEWYMVFYPLRTLMLGAKLLNRPDYIPVVEHFVDLYLTEQLPGGGFTSTFRHKPTAALTKEELHRVMRRGNVNIADNGSNVLGVVQAASFVSPEKKEQYLAAARRWFDEWLPIWILPNGGFNNGLWAGQPTPGAYTCAIGTATAALAAFGLATGEYDYIKTAEDAISYQMDQWFEELGLPQNMDAYNLSDRPIALNDFGHSFYLLEGMVWTHFASKNEAFRKRVEERLTAWLFSPKGLLSQWRGSWFNYMVLAHPFDEKPTDPRTSRADGIRLGWEMAKSNGIPHAFLYYLHHVEENPQLRDCVEKGIRYLSHPLKCRMSGVMSDPEESYGAFAAQATGFAGLSVAEYLVPDSVFTV